MLLLSLLTTTSKRMEKIFRVCNLYQYLPTQQASTELYLEKSWYCITKSSRDITKMCDIAINFAYNCLSVSPTRHDKGDENNRKIFRGRQNTAFFPRKFCAFVISLTHNYINRWDRHLLESDRGCEWEIFPAQKQKTHHVLSHIYFCVCHLTESLLSAQKRAVEEKKKKKKNALHTLHFQRPFCLSMYIHPFFFEWNNWKFMIILA